MALYGDECATEAVAVDGRAEMMREWIDLDNAVKKLEMQRVEADMKLSELRPKRTKLGQKIADTVYPQDVPTKSTEAEW